MIDKDDPDAAPFPTIVAADIAGVQGGDGEEDKPAAAPHGIRAEAPDAPSPDAAEIEWAGTVIKKPPHPAG
jgi:hypothetical protein